MYLNKIVSSFNPVETNIASLQRNIRDTRCQIEKLQEDEKFILQRIKKLASQLQIDKIRNKALSSEVEVLNKDLEVLNTEIVSYVFLLNMIQ